MENTVNFSTFYRPKTFADVVGQDIPKTVLKKIAAADGIAARAIFLKGSWGSGKTTLCRIFAKAMNCENFKKTGDVCNECHGCKEASTKNSQLYFEFDSSVVGNVDSIRALQEQLVYTPQGRRVVVFDEIHSASRAALNAMLKMVEEGIPNTIFVFASTEDILPTIKSRSICLDVTPIPHALMKEHLIKVANDRGLDVEDSSLDQICIKSGGHMRDALSLLQLYSLVGKEGLKSSYNSIYKFIVATLQKNRQAAETILKDVLKYPITDIRNSIALFIRNTFLAEPNDKLYQFQATGLNNKLFGYFYNSIQQSALKDEVGVEIVLRSFLNKLCK